MAKRRILLVDDESMFTRLVKLYLEDTERYEVRVENHGAHALETLREFRPDLVLLDIIMPDLDGAQVSQTMREDPVLRHVPIIFLTAIVSREEIGTQSVVIGQNPFIAKPAKMTVIMDTIERELAKADGASATRP